MLVTEKHQKLYGDISSLKDTMVENIDKVLERGERIDLLVRKQNTGVVATSGRNPMRRTLTAVPQRLASPRCSHPFPFSLACLQVDKSDALHEQSFVFKKSARRVRDEMWWKNTKLLLGMGGGALVSRTDTVPDRAAPPPMQLHTQR